MMSKDLIELALSVLKAEEANLTPDHLQQLAELTAAGEGIRSDVTDALKNTEKRELTPEQADKLIGTLKARFEASNNEGLRNRIDFADVEKALRASPEDLYALDKLEDGEPEVVGVDSDAFIFEDRSAESPAGRRNLNFDEADAQRESFGSNVEFQSRDSYKAMQETGMFDLNSWSYLRTSAKTRESDSGAMRGGRQGSEDRDPVIGVNPSVGKVKSPMWGWRASLRVKKV